MKAITLEEIGPHDTGWIRSSGGESLAFNSTGKTIASGHVVGVRDDSGELRIVADLGVGP